jgi:16S rRNA processing protein RimM
MSTVARAGHSAPVAPVAVGRVGSAHGIRGEVVVEPWTDDPQDRFAEGAVLQRAAGSTLRVTSARAHGSRLLVRFVGIDDRTAAEALRGCVLLVDPAARPPLTDPDEFYDSDLVGLVATTTSGGELGPVREILHLPGTDYLVIDINGQDRLVPFVAAIVPTVDVHAGRIVVDPPEGLFDL